MPQPFALHVVAEWLHCSPMHLNGSHLVVFSSTKHGKCSTSHHAANAKMCTNIAAGNSMVISSLAIGETVTYHSKI